MDDAAALHRFVEDHPRLFVLTGAGCSTASGIPDYRDADGAWKRTPPVTWQAFMRDPATRRRYWARSLLGWPMLAQARPNAAHSALAALEHAGRVHCLLTQNVDRLHQCAGSTRVIDLHGRIDRLRCTGCRTESSRADYQQLLRQRNPRWSRREAAMAPDGDADLHGADFTDFDVPDCPHCGGLLKPDVVFFGENVPQQRVDAAMQALAESDALLVVGSSLMVWSGYRFTRAAADAGLPIAAINLGRTRADPLLRLKVERACDVALTALTARLDAADQPLKVDSP
ncbi:MAG: NAD-dependent protein deacetylase [Sinimarinibacterium flocculans]|uniref:NAD-dependent protein deacetylase n=1 Tax=Sinimarinibacterium flocculans TaxID=985250 RepID=UPI003C4B6192